MSTILTVSLTVFPLDVSPQFARPQSLIGYGSRCDKLDQAETRSLLMCFLHIMKTISEGKKWYKHVYRGFTQSGPELCWIVFVNAMLWVIIFTSILHVINRGPEDLDNSFVFPFIELFYYSKHNISAFFLQFKGALFDIQSINRASNNYVKI